MTLYATQRRTERRAFARAVFRTIAFGLGEMGTKPWPKPEGMWEPRPREDLSDIMLAQRRDRKRPRDVRHGPFINGKQQPIRKFLNPFTHRYETNEV